MKAMLHALLFAATASTANAQTSAKELAGLWGAEMTFGPAARGELVIQRSGTGWMAQLDGRHRTNFRALGIAVDFDLGSDVGRFRGRFTRDSSAIRGHWMQAAHFTNGYRYSTPTTLTRRGDRWSAALTPLDDRFSMYLVMRERADTVRAFIRNPEANLWVERHFNVFLSGSTVTLINQQDSSDVIRGRYDAASKRLYLMIRELRNREVEFTLRDRNGVVGFYTRTPAPARYHYRQPEPRTDGWQVASLGEVQMDTALIDSLVRRIIASETRNVFSPYIHSLLIARKGKLVVEEYFHGFDAARAHDSRSLGKSFAAALVGAAQQSGSDIGPSTRVLPYFTDMRIGRPDPRKRRLQLRHFMTMTSGLDCDDNNWDSRGNEGRMQQQRLDRDYARYHLSLAMVHDPGKHYAYCSGSTNLVAAVVERVTRQWLPEFFHERIAEPLQFGTYHFQLTPTLTGYLGGGSYYTPRDMLKLGQLWLNGGEWNGRRIVPREWTEISVRADPLVQATGEGYHWHLNRLLSGNRRYIEYEGNGNGGQLVIVLPELDLVVGFTAGNYMNGGTWMRFRNELVTQFVIPAAR
jgi:CubicO group peptidase (beta-lactamase class C family)